jgi:hypothetical protein
MCVSSLSVAAVALQIKRLAGDCQMTRDEVLAYLKWWGTLSDQDRKNFCETWQAAEDASARRQTFVEDQKAAKAAKAAEENKKYQGAYWRRLHAAVLTYWQQPHACMQPHRSARYS